MSNIKNDKVNKIGNKGVDSNSDNNKELNKIKEFLDKNTEDLAVSSIPESLKKNIGLFVSDLKSIESEISQKVNTFIVKYSTIDDKIKILVKHKIIKVDDSEIHNSRAAFLKYRDSLIDIKNELNNDIKFFEDLISSNPPKFIKVLKGNKKDFLSYLQDKLKESKRYLKRVTKDVRISYSRYILALDNQLHKLLYLEEYIRSMAAKQEVGGKKQERSEKNNSEIQVDNKKD